MSKQKGQTFGVEFEMASKKTQQWCARQIQTAFSTAYYDKPELSHMYFKHLVDTDNHGYHTHNPQMWGVEYDSSIYTDEVYRNQIEVISPILTMHDLPAIKIMLNAISPVCRVDKSCGFHVHVGVKDFETAQKAGILWFLSEDEIIDVFPMYRHNNEYCMRTQSLLNRQYFDIFELGRHSMINPVESFETHGTVEFRGHSATLNYQKIKKWILFCLSFIRLADSINKETLNESLHGPYAHQKIGLFDKLDINGTKVERYFKYRKAHFNKISKKRKKKNKKGKEPLTRLQELIDQQERETIRRSQF